MQLFHIARNHFMVSIKGIYIAELQCVYAFICECARREIMGINRMCTVYNSFSALEKKRKIRSNGFEN